MLSFLVVSLLGGCGGGGFCQKQAKLAEDCGDPLDDASIEACEDGLEGCSAADEAKLNDFADCVNDLAPCGEQPDGTDGFAIFGCFGSLEGISPGCGELTFGTTPTDGTTASR